MDGMEGVGGGSDNGYCHGYCHCSHGRSAVGMLLVVGVILLVQLRIASKGASSKADMRYESQPEGGVRAQQRMLEDIKRRAPADSPAEREVDSFHNRRMTPLSFLMMKIFGTLVLPEEQE